MPPQLETLDDLQDHFYQPSGITIVKPEPEVVTEEPTSPAEKQEKPKDEEATASDSKEKTETGDLSTETGDEKSEEKSEEPKQEEAKEEGHQDASFLKLFGLEKAPETVDQAIDVLKKAEKIVTDSRSSYNKEHQTLIEHQAIVDSLKEKVATLETKQQEILKQNQASQEEDFVKDFDEAYQEDPAKALKDMFVKIRADIVKEVKGEVLDEDKIAEIAGTRILEQQEIQCKKDHPDYDEVVKPFVQTLLSDPELEKRWNEKGRTAEACYQLAKEHQEFQEILKNPTGYRERVIKEYEETKRKPSEKEEISKKLPLAGATSGSVTQRAGQMQSLEDVDFYG